MKILLVDDDVFLRDMYATKFTECGHEVQAVDQAEAALTTLRAGEAFDVVLVDMVMPGMTGSILLQTMKDEGLATEAMWIVLSNQGQQADINEAIEAGASSYIIKAEHVPSEVVSKVESLHADYQKK